MTKRLVRCCLLVSHDDEEALEVDAQFDNDRNRVQQRSPPNLHTAERLVLLSATINRGK